MDDDALRAPVTDDAPKADTDRANILAQVTSDLHDIYDPVLGKSLPIYFGPLLGELFLVDR